MGVLTLTLVDFLLKLGELKRTVRTGWLNRGVAKGSVESVAEHSYRTVAIAMVIADTLSSSVSLSKEKVLMMAVMHDASEVYLKDIDRQAWSYISPNHQNKGEIEQRAVSGLFSTLPDALSQAYNALWLTYREKQTLEARIVEAADKIELILQAYDYIQQGIPFHNLKSMIQDAENSLRDLGLDYISVILDELRNKIENTPHM